MILLVKIWMNKFLYNRIKFKILWEIGLDHVNAFIIICLRDDFLITFIPSICVRILTKEMWRVTKLIESNIFVSLLEWDVWRGNYKLLLF